MIRIRASRSLLAAAGLLFCATACVSGTDRARRTNVLEYLYPEGKPATTSDLVQLDIPLNIGVAFVPDEDSYSEAVTPGVKEALLRRVREEFADAEGVGRIEVVPESFVQPGGGFDNVDQIRSGLGIDLIALVSYDQTQFDDPNLASITYWTIVGAYVIPGNENETHTLVHASVFDIESRALLFNASGNSLVEGRTAAMNLDRALREDRISGFEAAVEDMIVNLDAALAQFREQVAAGTVRGKGTPAVEVTSASDGESVGAGALGASGPLALVLGLLMFLLAPPVVGRRG